MDTARIDICYRPLRIGWAVRSGDFEALRHAVRISHTLWGGRFNPIVAVDFPEASDIVSLFRIDFVVPLGETTEVAAFAGRFPYLINPLFPNTLHLRDAGQPGRAHILDVHNAMVHWHDTPAWRFLHEQGMRTFSWEDDDALADSFLMQFGRYPTEQEIGIDYTRLLLEAALPIPIVDTRLEKDRPIGLETGIHRSVAYLSRFGLQRHYSVRAGWDFPGFYVGSASDFRDLINFWNLRAADIPLLFLDYRHMSRYEHVRPQYEEKLRADLAHLPGHRRNPAVWAQARGLEEAVKLFPGGGVTACGVDEHLWRGGAVRPPTMILGQESSLGVMGAQDARPQVSFALSDKPFCGDTYFFTQHLVASISLGGGTHGNSQHTFRPPYVPELNEFLAREMCSVYNKLRAEPERVGLIIDATGRDEFLRALPSNALAEKLFDMCGLQAKPSAAGLITRQLIARLGGVDRTRALKIPGVRRLIKTYGPRHSFTKSGALQLIGGRDPENPSANFSDHERLYIEPRPASTKLTANMVFAHLVERGLFRIGAELKCPACNLASWISLEQLEQKCTCELCGAEYDATRQLVSGEFRYRRSGVLGLEQNAQGAIPVSLLLQQLSVNIVSIHHDGLYLPSFDLVPKAGIDLPKCETDFLVILPDPHEWQTQIVIGESKDRGGSIDAQDIENMRSIADAFPARRFDVYILFAKLSPFTAAEIALAKSINEKFHSRVILLTDQELEPYHLYERHKDRLGDRQFVSSPDEAARVTEELYFRD